MIIKATAAFVAFLLMIGAFFYYIASLGIRVSPPDNRVDLSVEVADVNNIVVDSNVLLRGVPVGKVTGIDATLAHATIHFYVKDEYRIPADSLVRLENLSALGESYLELEPRSAAGPPLQNGQLIAKDSVQQPASISELGTSVVRVLNQLDPGQLTSVVNEADAALPDPYATLPNLERASTLLLNTTTDLDGRGSEALDNVQSLLENAGFVGPALADATPSMRELGPSIRQLWDRGSENVIRIDAPGNVYIFGKFLQRLQKLLDDRGSDIRVLTEPLLANVNAIAAALRTIDTGQVLGNLLAAVPEDGAINLHVSIPEGQAPNDEATHP